MARIDNEGRIHIQRVSPPPPPPPPRQVPSGRNWWQRRSLFTKFLIIGTGIWLAWYLITDNQFTSSSASTTQQTAARPTTHITIPSNVTHIRDREFANRGLTSITIPNSVVSIGANAFANNQLTSITIPNSVREIGLNAFAGNPITRIDIGANVTLRFDSPTGIVGVLGSGTRFNSAYNDAGRRAGTYTRRDASSTTWYLNGQVIRRQTTQQPTRQTAPAPPVRQTTTPSLPPPPASQQSPSQTTAQRPSPPRNLRNGTPGTDNVTISWDNAGSGISYRVYWNRHQNNFLQARVLSTTTRTSMEITGLTPNTNYYFWVISIQDNRESDRSSAISVRTAPRGVR